ncbi:unnamed protein product, partial [Owenia fusiformis]
NLSVTPTTTHSTTTTPVMSTIQSTPTKAASSIPVTSTISSKATNNVESSNSNTSTSSQCCSSDVMPTTTRTACTIVKSTSTTTNATQLHIAPTVPSTSNSKPTGAVPNPIIQAPINGTKPTYSKPWPHGKVSPNPQTKQIQSIITSKKHSSAYSYSTSHDHDSRYFDECSRTDSDDHDTDFVGVATLKRQRTKRILLNNVKSVPYDKLRQSIISYALKRGVKVTNMRVVGKRSNRNGIETLSVRLNVINSQYQLAVSNEFWPANTFCRPWLSEKQYNFNQVGDNWFGPRNKYDDNMSEDDWSYDCTPTNC